MEPTLVVSPHYDDAVLSVGAFMAGAPGCFVLTVMGGLPDASISTGYDKQSGFSDARQAVTERRKENRRALSAVRAAALDGDLLDGQYRTLVHDDRTHDELAKVIVEQIIDAANALGAKRIIGPVGVGHPDHKAVGYAMKIANAALDDTWRIWCYEELPYRVLEPAEMVAATNELADDLGATLDFIGDGPPSRKGLAIRQYRSQLWALDQRALGVPERVWRLRQPWVEPDA